jgi:hypothetical protein
MQEATMRTDVGKPQGRDEARPLHVVIETKEDYALAQQKINALRHSPKDESAEQELAALRQAVSDWDNGKGRKRGYPV